MPETTTDNLVLTKPEPGASRNSWGGTLNEDLNIIDGVFETNGNGPGVGLHIGSTKTLRISGAVVVATDAAGIPGTGITDDSIPAAKLAFSAGNMIPARKATGAGKGSEFPCSDQSFDFLAAATKADARAVIGAAGADDTGDTPFISTDASAAAGPVLSLDRQSPSPADADLLGRLSFKGRNAANAAIEYAAIQAQLDDVEPNGNRAGSVDFLSMLANALAVRFSLGGGLYARGVTGGDKGDGTINAKGLFIDGTAVGGGGGGGGGAGSMVSFWHFPEGAGANTTNAIPTDNTTPTSSEGHQFMSLALTPKASGNILRVDVVFCFEISTGGVGNEGTATAALFIDSDTSAVAAASSGANTEVHGTINFTYVMTAPSGAAITFKVRAGPNDPARTMYFNRDFNGKQASSITVTEIQQ